MKQEEFLEDVSNWNNFMPLLWIGLQQSQGLVCEYGSGGSTALLKKYCKANKRTFRSYDYNQDWAKKTGAQYVQDWDLLALKKCGLAFVDNSPGESRQGLIMRLLNLADIICVHDTEIGGAGNYGYNFDAFQYQLHYNRHGGGAGAALISNKINVSQFKGLKLSSFTFDND